MEAFRHLERPSGDIPTVSSLGELADLIRIHERPYLRWSQGPAADGAGQSRDDLTGVDLPGLSVSALAVEDWWGGRSLRVWVARRLYDYRHLEYRRPGARPWVLLGEECGRGPDNEPLVCGVQPIAWVARDVVEEGVREIEQLPGDWGPLDRTQDPSL